MTCMFYGNGVNLYALDISGWDTGNVKSFNHMFCDCNKLKSLNLKKWNTAQLKTTYDMFDDCYALTTVGDISHWNTENLVDCGGMFNGCSSFAGENGTLDLSGWNTENLLACGEMFRAVRLKTIDLRGWNTENVCNRKWDNAGYGIYYEYGNMGASIAGFGQMFLNCPNLKRVIVSSNWIINDGVNTLDMFTGCPIEAVTIECS